MPAFFFDTSAVVKLYHSEVGTPAVQILFGDSGSAIRISRLTVSELISAFAIKVRTQIISRRDAELLYRQVRAEIAIGRLEVHSLTEAVFSSAEQLLEHYAFDFRLRAPDALQLALALQLQSRELVDNFVAADATLCDVATREGLRVINPLEV